LDVRRAAKRRDNGAILTAREEAILNDSIHIAQEQKDIEDQEELAAAHASID
jgi:hypothetical protein